MPGHGPYPAANQTQGAGSYAGQNCPGQQDSAMAYGATGLLCSTARIVSRCNAWMLGTDGHAFTHAFTHVHLILQANTRTSTHLSSVLGRDRRLMFFTSTYRRRDVGVNQFRLLTDRVQPATTTPEAPPRQD